VKEDDLLPDLSALEAGNVAELVATFAPKLLPTLERADLVGTAFSMGFIGAIIALIAAQLAGLAVSGVGVAMGVMSLGGAVGAVIGVYERRARHRRSVRHFTLTCESNPLPLYEKIAQHFKVQINVSRARMLGPQSDWHRSRAPLEAAKDEADRSVAYWSERLKEDKENSVAVLQLTTAKSLKSKFSDALRELDSRSDALLSFFNRCEAKLAMLEQTRSDHMESERLAALSDRAGEVVNEAASALDLIGQTFLRDTANVGQAIAGLRQLHAKELAGPLPLEHIELVADRIIEVWQEDNEALAQLENAMHKSDASA